MMNFIIEDFEAGEETKKNGGEYKPNYEECIRISTQASLQYMIAPGALVILSPIILGIFFGPAIVEGLLAGAIVSGVQVAISASNTGGAWDNCKKEIEKKRGNIRQRAAKLGLNKDKLKSLPKDISDDASDEIK